jgi:hypothetical protein
MAKNRGGQPKPASERQTAKILLTMLESEKAAFEQAATLDGLKTSAWMRTRLRNAATQELTKYGLKPQFLPKTPKRREGESNPAGT